MFIEPVEVWVMITGTLRWEIMIFFRLLSVNLVVPLLTAWSLWLISVLHAPQKLCDSASAMLGSIFLTAGCCGYVRQSALEGCFYEHWPIYQTKESKQWNGREGECNLRGALCNSSGLPSVLQRGLLFSHALQLGFWSVIIKEIKIWKWMWNTLLHYVLIWSLRRTNAVRCTGKMVVQAIRIQWMRRDNLSSRMKIYLKSGRAGALLSSSLGRNCVDQFSHWSSMPYSVSVRDPWLVSFGLQDPKNSDSSSYSQRNQCIWISMLFVYKQYMISSDFLHWRALSDQQHSECSLAAKSLVLK